MKKAIIIENCENYDLIRNHEKFSKYIFVDIGSEKKLLDKYKLDCYLYLYEKEEVIVCKNFNHNSQTFITDGNWMILENRIYPKPTEKSEPIVIKTNKYLEMPFMSNKKLINLFKEKKYEEFSIESEKYKFENEFNMDVFTDYYLAMTYFFKLKNLPQAEKTIAGFINKNLNFAEGWCLLGDMFVHNKRYIEAMKAYENALEYGGKRNIYDGQPICLRRYTVYPNEMLKKIKQLIENTTVVSIDHL